MADSAVNFMTFRLAVVVLGSGSRSFFLPRLLTSSYQLLHDAPYLIPGIPLFPYSVSQDILVYCSSRSRLSLKTALQHHLAQSTPDELFVLLYE
jgi:hypothetical protein